MQRTLRRLVIAAGGLALAVTALPLIPSNAWWIRIWDFPRTQIAVLLVLVAGAFVLSLSRRRTLAYLALLMVALAWQIHAIWPYTPLYPVQVKPMPACDPGSRIRLLVANVLIDNRDAKPLLALVDDVDPDVVLLVETDAWWDRALAPLKAVYAQTIAYPREDSYGIHLFSRFKLVEPRVRFLIEDYVPSIRTGLLLPSGARIDFHGLHPKPPPLADTDQRDAELLIVGKAVRQAAVPSIVAGDLNDVAWSRTNGLFQEISGLLDPRIGRGLYATFNADWRLLRWPLDHVFFSDSFALIDIAVMPDIGSDHFPFFASLCLSPAAAAIQEQPQPEPSDLEAADEAIEEGRSEAAE